ncbi:MAG: iron-containing alcohol dehydrogenase, partial [Sporichthyaceae bacterium]|nr:iron-containing alcohol dehydrogenase [Sporichthyaceae bacterium]
TAMNSLAHAVEATCAPLANPWSTAAALEAVRLYGRNLAASRPDPVALATAAVLAGCAIGLTGLGAHHILSQAVVTVAGTPHAATNAVLLPHTAALMARTHSEAMAAVAAALGLAGTGDLTDRLIALAGPTRPAGLAALGAQVAHIDDIIAAAISHRWFARSRQPPSSDELAKVVRAAWGPQNNIR